MVAVDDVPMLRRRAPGDAQRARELVRRYAAGERSFPGLRLSRVTLRNESLSGIDLRGADLRGADLTGCRLGHTQLADAKIGSVGVDRAVGILGILVSLALSTVSILALGKVVPAVSLDALPSPAPGTVGVMLLAGIAIGARHAKSRRAVPPILVATAGFLLVVVAFAGSSWLRTALDVVPNVLLFVLVVACFVRFWWPPEGIVQGSAEHIVVVATRTGRVVILCVGVLTCWTLLAAHPLVVHFPHVVAGVVLFAVAALTFGQALTLLTIEFGIAVVFGSLCTVCFLLLEHARHQPVPLVVATLLPLLANVAFYFGPTRVGPRHGATRRWGILGGTATLTLVIIALADAKELDLPTLRFLVVWAAVFCGALLSLIAWEGRPIGRLLVRPILSLRQRHCTQFTEVYLGSATLQNTNLTAVRMARANLVAVTLEGQRLVGATLREADLSRSLLRGADLSWADLQEANLSRANLRSACLRGANLRGANLSYADLGGADLRHADMRNVSMDRTVLTDTALDGALLPGDMRRDNIYD